MRRIEVTFGELPEELQREWKETISSLLKEEVDEALHDYFGCENIDELIQSGDSNRTLSVRLNDTGVGSPFLSLGLVRGKQKLELSTGFPDLQSFSFKRGEFVVSARGVGMWAEVLRLNNVPAGDVYYLPAARSGIMQGWQVLASMAVQIVRRRLGLQRIEIPPLTGVAGDFLQILWEGLLPRYPKPRQVVEKFDPVLDILEGKVFQGEVSVDRAKTERPLIVYRSGDLVLPLHRASSMIAELSPLDLWIKYFLKPGDLIIIDEPEAHLHPENQRRVATVLVRLVRAGVKVVCTTHSSLILHQVSNHILAAEADAASRKKAGFTKDDLLTGDEVGIYLFERKADGTHVGSVPIQRGFGISEDEFVRVAEAIGDETYSLSASAKD